MLTNRELATVLAALRYWQRDLESADKLIDGEHFVDQRPLCAAEIDELCERLNFAAQLSSSARGTRPYRVPFLTQTSSFPLIGDLDDCIT